MDFILILAAHLFADFVFQTDKMAKGKSSSLKWLSIHILEYSFVLAILCAFFLNASLESLWVFIAINCLSHFVIDYFTSKISSYLWKQGETHHFFVTVGCDQYLHTAILYLTYLQWSGGL